MLVNLTEVAGPVRVMRLMLCVRPFNAVLVNFTRRASNELRIHRSTVAKIFFLGGGTFLSYTLEKKSSYSTYSSFLVINICNQGKALCSSCTI